MNKQLCFKIIEQLQDYRIELLIQIKELETINTDGAWKSIRVIKDRDQEVFESIKQLESIYY